MAQAEQLKQQTLATLSEKDQQLRRLTAVLEEAHSHKPLLQQQHYQKQVGGINVCTLVVVQPQRVGLSLIISQTSNRVQRRWIVLPEHHRSEAAL